MTEPFKENPLRAIIQEGTRFEGKLTFEGTLSLGGEFIGEIFTRDTLVIQESARVKAEIEADTVILSGHVEGNLTARKRVIMHMPAVFRGTVTSPSLQIDEGVVFEGASYVPNL